MSVRASRLSFLPNCVPEPHYCRLFLTVCRNKGKTILAVVPSSSMQVHLFEVNDELSVMDMSHNRRPPPQQQQPQQQPQQPSQQSGEAERQQLQSGKQAFGNRIVDRTNVGEASEPDG